MKENNFSGIEDIFETVREPLLVLDVNLNILSANRSFYNIFKVEQGETIGHLIFDVGNKQWDIPALRTLLEEILPTHKRFDNYEVEHDFPTIGHKTMLLNARQVYRKDVGTQMILLAIEDITERSQLESLLEESEERYRYVFETANDGILLLEKHEGKITHANPAAREMLGYSKEECIGKKLQNIGVSLDMDDFQKIMQTLDKSGIIYYDDVRVKTKTGQYIDTDIYMVDRARSVQCNIRDITERKRAEERIRESEERYQNLFENAHDMIQSVAPDGHFIFVNPAWLKTMGYTWDDLQNITFIDILHTSCMPHCIEAFQKVISGESVSNVEAIFITKDGRQISVEGNVSARLVGGVVIASQGIFRDLTDRKRVEAEREKLLQDLAERVKELGCMNDISRLAEKPWVSIEEFVQQAVNILPPAWQYPEICCARIMLDSKEFKTANFRETEWSQVADIKVDRKKFGAVTICYLEEKPAVDEGPFLKEERILINTVADFLGHIIQHRLSEAEIRASEEKLKYLAYYDTLTGLPNRNLFLERINEEIAEAKDSSSSLAVLLTDINKFKSIYDIYGSEVGDRVLKEVAGRLSTAVRKGDTVAHLGNNEFGIACIGITGADDIIMLEKIIKDISYPLKIDGDEIIMTFSTGISLYPYDGENASELLKSAGLALSIAEKQGMKTSQFYTKDMTVTASGVLLLEKQLINAIKNEEFILHYQPYWDITTKKMVGMEALVRWQSQDKGLVPPGKFIPILEDTGMIIEVGEWILREAMRQVKEWQNNGYPVVPVSVNMSLVQFRQKDLAGMVKKIMKDCGYYPSLLTLEITESAFMQDIEFTKSVLTEMKETGCSVSIDDFGTGYSSLAYLKRFPIDNLKIDISFIREMVKDPDSASIVMAIINMAHTLNLKTIAEGIETEEQWNFLRLLRCDMGQGFYLSKPLPAEEIEKLLI